MKFKYNLTFSLIKDYRLYLVLSLVFGIFIRFYGLEIQSLWLDELYTVVNASSGATELYTFLLGDVHPPFHYLLMLYWIRLFGNSVFVVRCFSALIGSASLIYMYYYSKQFFSKYIATSATILMSFTYPGIYYSQEARSYILLILLSLISTFLFIKIISTKKEETQLQDHLLYLISSILLMYTHYFGLLLVIFQLSYWIIVSIIYKNERSNAFMTACVLFVAYFIWIPIAFDTMITKGGGNFWIPKPDIQFFTRYWYFITYPLELPQRIVFLSLLIVPLILNPRGIISKIVNSSKNIQLKSPITILVYFVVAIPTFTFILSQHTPVLIERNLLIISPFIYILIAMWVSLVKQLQGYKQVAYIFFICIFCFTILAPTYYQPYKEQWREAVDYSVKISDEKTAIIVLNRMNFFQYYFEKSKIPENVLLTEKGSNDSNDMYALAVNRGKNKLIVLGAHGSPYDFLNDSDQKILENYSAKYELLQLRGAIVYTYYLK